MYSKIAMEWFKDRTRGWDTVAISREGSLLAAATRAQRIKVFALNETDPEQRNHYSLPTTRLTSGIAFSRDGSMFSATGTDGVLTVWRTGTDYPVASIRVDGPLASCAWSPTNDVVAAAGIGGLYLFALRAPGPRM
ncbi:hypothetical protein [Embleya sp. NPDC001921]